MADESKDEKCTSTWSTLPLDVALHVGRFLNTTPFQKEPPDLDLDTFPNSHIWEYARQEDLRLIALVCKGWKVWSSAMGRHPIVNKKLDYYKRNTRRSVRISLWNARRYSAFLVKAARPVLDRRVFVGLPALIRREAEHVAYSRVGGMRTWLCGGGVDEDGDLRITWRMKRFLAPEVQGIRSLSKDQLNNLMVAALARRGHRPLTYLQAFRLSAQLREFNVDKEDGNHVITQCCVGHFLRCGCRDAWHMPEEETTHADSGGYHPVDLAHPSIRTPSLLTRAALSVIKRSDHVRGDVCDPCSSDCLTLSMHIEWWGTKSNQFHRTGLVNMATLHGTWVDVLAASPGVRATLVSIGSDRDSSKTAFPWKSFSVENAFVNVASFVVSQALCMAAWALHKRLVAAMVASETPPPTMLQVLGGILWMSEFGNDDFQFPLCPSVRGKAVHNNAQKADFRVVTSMHLMSQFRSNTRTCAQTRSKRYRAGEDASFHSVVSERQEKRRARIDAKRHRRRW